MQAAPWASPGPLGGSRSVRFDDGSVSADTSRLSLRSRGSVGTPNKALHDSANRSRSRSRSRDPPERRQRRPVRQTFTSSGWRHALKSRRLATVVRTNLLIQAFVIVLFCARITFDFSAVLWSIVNLKSIFLFALLMLVPQVVVVIFAKCSSVEYRGQLVYGRLIEQFSRASTYYMLGSLICCALFQQWFLLSLAYGSRARPLYVAESFRYVIGVALFAMLYALDTILNDRAVLHFPSIQRPIHEQLKGRAVPVFLQCIKLVILFELVYIVLPTHSIALLPFGLSGTPNPFSYRSEISFVLILFFICLSWRVSLNVMEVALTQSLLAEEDAALPLHFMVDVLKQDQDMYSKYLASMELQDLSQRSAAGRHFIYTNDNGRTWADICGICTSALDALSVSLYEEIENPTAVSRFSFSFMNSSRQRTQELFSRLPLYMWLAQSLSFLAFHSITEDDIGGVQRSFETLLSSLLSCSLAVEAYVQSPSFASHQKKTKLNGSQLVRLEPLALSTCLDNSIYRIVGKFYSHLKQFSFPRDEARRLRQFAAYER